MRRADDSRVHSVSRRRWRFRIAAITAIAGVLASYNRSGLAAEMPSQQEVEAVYLFDFSKFVRWPVSGTQGPIRMCIAAGATFTAGIQKTVFGEQIDGRSLEVRHVSRAEDVEGCAILFVDATQRGHEDALLAAVSGKPTLTVSDAPGFLERGGMIQFEIVRSRVRFSVNLAAVNHGNLSMSSELLKVAYRVEGNSSPGGAP